LLIAVANAQLWQPRAMSGMGREWGIAKDSPRWSRRSNRPASMRRGAKRRRLDLSAQPHDGLVHGFVP
jgi:hypothetical protein